MPASPSAPWSPRLRTTGGLADQWLFDGQRLTLRWLLGVIVGLAGATLLCLGGIHRRGDKRH